MWGTILSWVLGNIGTKWIVVAAGVVVLAGAGYMRYKYVSLENELVASQVQVKQLEAKVVQKEMDIKRLQVTVANEKVNREATVEVVKKADVKLGKVADKIDALVISF